MLDVRGLRKEYKRHLAVNDLTFNVQPGEIIGLLGPNGAGKTTALRCIAGILRPTGGEVFINGFDVVQDQARAKANLAFVPEVPALYELLTVEEHLKFIAMCFKRMDLFESQKETLLSRYRLSDKRNELVATLSKGMRQKLSVACALIHDANVLLFDEPLIGIDPEGARELKDEITRARDAGAAILISTHLLDTAEKLCDRLLIVQRGILRAQGTVAELREQFGTADQSLEDIFLSITAEDPPPVLSA